MVRNLGRIEQIATSAISNVTNVATGVVENTISDIDFILRRTGDCIRAQGQIAERVAFRSLEYRSATIRLLAEIGTIPLELIIAVIEELGGSIRRDPNPRLLQLTNPFDFVHDGKAPILNEIDVNTLVLRTDRWPLVFVHGASIFNGSLRIRELDFYSNFERAARMFNPVNQAISPNYRDNADVYIISWDSRQLNTDRSRIRTAFSNVLRDSVTDLTNLMYSAVFWREMERRAVITAEEVLLPFFNRMSGKRFTNSRLISHSLGCYVVATAADRFMRNNTSDPNGLFTSWFCMAPALPAGAFTNTGEFEFAPNISPAPDDLPYGTSVWWNPIDSAFLAYNMVSSNLAMGQTGALLSRFALTNFVTTRFVGVAHEDNYFNLLSPVLQETLNTGARINNNNLVQGRYVQSQLKKKTKKSPLRSSKKRKPLMKKNLRLKKRKFIKEAEE